MSVVHSSESKRNSAEYCGNLLYAYTIILHTLADGRRYLLVFEDRLYMSARSLCIDITVVVGIVCNNPIFGSIAKQIADDTRRGSV